MSLTDVPILWRLPETALRASFAEMAIHGRQGCEGVALWLGRRSAGIATVTHVVALRGSGIVRHPHHLSISAELLSDVTDVAIEHEAFLVGQIHSHPGDWVDLSDADRLYGIRAPGYLSVVAPHFARDPATPIERCGFHIFARERWRRLGPLERRARVRMTDGSVPLTLVGEEK